MAGQWTFLDDGTVIDIRPCPDVPGNACGMIVQPPRAAYRRSEAELNKLCGAVLVDGLVPQESTDGGAPMLIGQIADPATLLGGTAVRRYPVDISQASAHRALVEVRGPLGLVVERYTLIRRIAPAPRCD